MLLLMTIVIVIVVVIACKLAGVGGNKVTIPQPNFGVRLPLHIQNVVHGINLQITWPTWFL
jgi:hypothetical protein